MLQQQMLTQKVLAAVALVLLTLPSRSFQDAVDDDSTTCAADGCLPTVAIVGAGRMGIHLAATWADAGAHVVLCSRDARKSQRIVASLLAGKGWMHGQIKVPPTTDGSPGTWTLTSGSYNDAAEADLIVLAVVHDLTVPLIKDVLGPKIRGKSKIVVDINNPWIMGNGLPAHGPQSSLEIYTKALGDETASWCTGYKTIYWYTILPGGAARASGDIVEIVGDAACKTKLAALVRSHGFEPKDMGGANAAAALEWRFQRGGGPVRVQSGEKVLPGQ